jgi:hypothetical protein
MLAADFGVDGGGDLGVGDGGDWEMRSGMG